MRLRSSMPHTLYILGLLLIFPVIVLGQLLWVLDPIRLPGGLYLIDYVHMLIAITAVIPILWTITAVRLWITGPGPASIVLLTLRILVTAASLMAIFMILSNPKQLFVLGLSLAVAIFGVLADLMVSEYRVRKAWPYRSTIWVVSMGIVLSLLLCPTGYLVTYPGMTMNMHRYADVEGGTKQGSISGVLIFERPAFPVDWLYAALFPHYTFEKQEELGMSLGEYQHVVRMMKSDANTVAAAVALGKLGIGEGVTYHGVIVAAVVADSPVKGVLMPGDVIVEMNGESVTRPEQLLQMMSMVRPQQTVDLEVIREGSRVQLQVKTAASQEDPERSVMGIQIMEDIRYDVPREIAYTPYLLHEGGPSHGAMLTLAIIDQLTPGGVTYGQTIAGTGTIRPDGSIGWIGGIQQKAYTVEKSGADVFFVPKGQEEEAQLGAGELNIVPVRTIDDILLWLKQHPDG